MNKRRDFRMAEVIRFILFNYTMWQTLQQQWEEVLQSLLEIAQNGLDKAPDYVLDFFNRFQAWKIIDSVTRIIIFGIIGSLIWYRLYKTLSRKDIDWDYDDKYVFWTIFWSVAVFISIGFVIYWISEIIQASILPEMSLIDFLKNK
jgi:hypothetical protein